jgi:hypothetical protein
MKLRPAIARILKASNRRCFKRWGRAITRWDWRRRRTAENFLGIAFLWVSRWMRMGRRPAASQKRKKGFRKVRFI